ncbi:Hypothetical predicted protein [Olea europaea subsp. europaea]|uniref:Uncharacterized protein n=1 Tax=Olea europaea subsp. europaea TaxID=158383 RepID=A0A8S0U7K0_OLEEU|nr:Hypothetical predicted protein [Olea europaea subsp. europaea]
MNGGTGTPQNGMAHDSLAGALDHASVAADGDASEDLMYKEGKRSIMEIFLPFLVITQMVIKRTANHSQITTTTQGAAIQVWIVALEGRVRGSITQSQ